ncbi:MAG TPA: Hsp20/alpha crystallin family protein [Sulfuricella sp.]|nr:Hsp20/alpha crystallin family protein [Sulfuricella sp.]
MNQEVVSKKEKEVQAMEKAQPVRALAPFEEMERTMEKMFDRFFRRGWMTPFRWDETLFPEFSGERMPRVDVIERDAEILVRAEVPGYARDDLNISLTEDTVTLSGKTRREEKEEKGNYHRMEISSGEFSRTLHMPAGIDGAKAGAKFKDGVLELTLPKLRKSERHTVKIKEG